MTLMKTTSRRDFLKKLIASGLSTQLNFDLDKLLWVPGAKTIFLPSPSISYSDIVALEMERILPHLRNIFDRDDLFYKLISNRPELKASGGSQIHVPLHSFKRRDEI